MGLGSQKRSEDLTHVRRLTPLDVTDIRGDGNGTDTVDTEVGWTQCGHLTFHRCRLLLCAQELSELHHSEACEPNSALCLVVRLVLTQESLREMKNLCGIPEGVVRQAELGEECQPKEGRSPAIPCGRQEMWILGVYTDDVNSLTGQKGAILEAIRE
ncbi:hypothetical protein An02g11020 [Aspergillus niger]|uniref:Uncharacterized protein n=2 Tax=Aspergillus niger TaxID=5061 RepID=A2QEG8_ASPNC|nr:hypothetical protein An02g11020 [Aspergillus niger]CAK48767.1 hypothetical protein An02g11020 [Aspergillus niger]